MDITFLGATRTVTGSAFLISVGNRRIMVDCGLYQGLPAMEERNYTHPAVDWSEVDAILVTHAHIDHCGLIPRAVKLGYRGPVYSHPATIDLAEVMLKDAAEINRQDTDWLNRKRARAGREPIEPLFDENDVTGALKMFRAVQYNELTQILPYVNAEFRDAGHILGSASIALDCEESGLKRRIVFSGDIGHHQAPILREPQGFENADVVLVETTYGTRLHASSEARWTQLADIVNSAYSKRGKILIPAFTVGRTQELLYILSEMIRQKEIPPVNIYLDSPMGIRATKIHENHPECFDNDTLERIKAGDNPFKPLTLHFAETIDQSMSINNVKDTIIVIAGSGMCQGGRIVHHLKHNLYNPDNHIVFVGYQAEGTLGRLLQNKPKNIKLLGENIAVRASIQTIDAFSGHADKNGLIDWLGKFKAPPMITFMIHGDEHVGDEFASTVREVLGFNTYQPKLLQRIDLARPDEAITDKRQFITIPPPKASDVQEIVARVTMMGHEFGKMLAIYAMQLRDRIKESEKSGRVPHWKMEDVNEILEHLADEVGVNIAKLESVMESSSENS